jgi:hypothetical protein
MLMAERYSFAQMQALADMRAAVESESEEYRQQH